jgi:hypothetical protein
MSSNRFSSNFSVSTKKLRNYVKSWQEAPEALEALQWLDVIYFMESILMFHVNTP